MIIFTSNFHQISLNLSTMFPKEKVTGYLSPHHPFQIQKANKGSSPDFSLFKITLITLHMV